MPQVTEVRVARSIKRNLGDYNSAGAEVEFFAQVADGENADQVVQDLLDKAGRHIEVAVGYTPKNPAADDVIQAPGPTDEQIHAGAPTPAAEDKALWETQTQVIPAAPAEPEISSSDFNIATAALLKAPAVGVAGVKAALAKYGVDNLRGVPADKRREFLASFNV